MGTAVCSSPATKSESDYGLIASASCLRLLLLLFSPGLLCCEELKPELGLTGFKLYSV